MRSLLLAFLLLAVEGLLYITKINEKPFKLPAETEQLSHKELRKELNRQGFRTEHLPLLHFDKAEDPYEVMRLSLEFFEDYLNEYQVQEIILNSNLKGLISGKWMRKNKRSIKNYVLMKKKGAILQMKLGFLRAETMGKDLDRVVERIPTRLYRFLRPLVALASSKFKATIEGFGILFYLTLGSISQLQIEAQAAILHTLQSLIALRNSPNRLFAAGELLIELAGRYKNISNLFMQRVNQFIGELHNMTTSMGLKALEQRSKLLLMNPNLRISHGSGRAKYELPITKSFIIPSKQATRTDKQMLVAETERCSEISQNILKMTANIRSTIQKYLPILQKFIKLPRNHMKEGLNTVSGIFNELLEHLFKWSIDVRNQILPYNLYTEKLLGFEFDVVDALVGFERFLVYQFKVIATASSDVYSFISTARIFSSAKSDAISTILMIVKKLNEILPSIINAITTAATVIQSRSSTAVRDLFGNTSDMTPKSLKNSQVKFAKSVKRISYSSSSSSEYTSSCSSSSSSRSNSSSDSLGSFLSEPINAEKDYSTDTRSFISTSDVSQEESSS